MWEYLIENKEKSNKKNWKPKFEELFTVLNEGNEDKDIQIFLHLLKYPEFKKVYAWLKKPWYKSFWAEKRLNKNFKKFVSYLLKNDRYKELFDEGMKRYKITWENKEIFDKVYKTNLEELEKTLKELDSWKVKETTPFKMSQIIKTLRGELFIFKLWEGVVWFEKSYLFDEFAKQINEDHSERPVYGLKAHVWENASIYAIKETFKDLEEFLRNVDVWIEPYVGMTSWLLDTDFLRFRCEHKGWKEEKINKMLKEYEDTLWKITLHPVRDKITEKRVVNRIKHHVTIKDKNNPDRNPLEEYFKKNWIKEWRSLKKLNIEKE